jgi:hypothetical protein
VVLRIVRLQSISPSVVLIEVFCGDVQSLVFRGASGGSSAGVTAGSRSDEEHIAALRSFYSDYSPEHVGRAEALFKKHGEKIWEQLEEKYPGTTAEFAKVLLDSVGALLFCPRCVLHIADSALCVVTVCRRWYFVRRLTQGSRQTRCRRRYRGFHLLPLPRRIPRL